MEERINNHEGFFMEIWNTVKPIIADLTGSLIVIIAVYCLGYVANLFPIDLKLKDSIHLLETIFVTGAIGLSSFRTLLRLVFPIVKDIKNLGGNDKDTSDGKDTREEKIDEIKPENAGTQTQINEKVNKPKQLSSKTEAVNDVETFKNSDFSKIEEKVKVK